MIRFTMNDSCPTCGTTWGNVEDKSGQLVVRCAGCERFLYNMTKRAYEKIKAVCLCGECKVCQDPEELTEDCKCFVAGWEAACNEMAQMAVRVQTVTESNLSQQGQRGASK